MADDQLEFSPLPLGSRFSPVLGSRTSHLLQSEQQKVNEAAFQLDKLSQELQSMWSTQGSPVTHEVAVQPLQTHGKDIPVTTANPFSACISNKSELRTKYGQLLPVTFGTQSVSLQSSQTHTPQTPEQVSSPCGYAPLLYPQQDQRFQPDRAPSPRLMSGSLTPYSQQDQCAQWDRAPSPRLMSASLTPYSQQDQCAQWDRAPSPRLMSGSLTPYSQQDQCSQWDRAPSPRLMSGPLIPYSPQDQWDRAPSPRLMSGPPTPYSPQDQSAQWDRAPSPHGFNPMTPLGKPDLPTYHTQSPLHELPSLPSSAVERVISQSPSLFSPALSPFTGPGCSPDLLRGGVNPRENVHPSRSPAVSVPERSKLTFDTVDTSPAARPKPEFTPELGAFNIHTGDTSKQRKPASVWAEADLDVAYEKKSSKTASHENKQDSNWNTGKQRGGWRQTDLDLAVSQNKVTGGRTKANTIQIYGTLPKNTRVPSAYPRWPHATKPRRPSPSWTGPSLPSPILARTSVPPGSPQASAIKDRRNVLPLSLFIRPTIVGNRGRVLGREKPQPGLSASSTLWRQVQPQPGPEASDHLPPVDTGEVEQEMAGIYPGEVDAVPRPLSPTRLQPVSLPDMEAVQDMEELLQIRAAIPRALKKRTSIDQPTAEQLPLRRRTHRYQQLTKLFQRSSAKKQQEMAEDMPSDPQSSPVKSSPVQSSPLQSIPVTESPASVPVTRSILKREGKSGTSKKMRARLTPLVILLDAALLGELDVVQRVVHEIDDPSQSNDEGITALHNAVCGGHYDIVEFLVNFGVDVNASDSHGWTPLHCAASCNDLPICTLLVKKGAAIFSMTLNDGATAAEKCDAYLDGYEECARFLFSAEQQAGMVNSAVLYALWDYEAENADELSFHEGETITILQRGNKEETQWWWSSLYGREGYVPYNLLGLFPRVRPAA